MTKTLFSNIPAWFSSSVPLELINQWVRYGGKVVDKPFLAHFLFSQDKAAEDTIRLFESEKSKDRVLTIFDPQLINDSKTENELSDINLGKYILNSPSDTKEFAYRLCLSAKDLEDQSSINGSTDDGCIYDEGSFIAKKILLHDNRNARLRTTKTKDTAERISLRFNNDDKKLHGQRSRSRPTRQAKVKAKKRLLKNVPIMADHYEDFTFPDRVVLKDLVHINELTIPDPHITIAYFVPQSDGCKVYGKCFSSC